MLQTILPFLFGVIDRVIPDEAQRQQAKLEVMKAENQQALSEIQASLSAVLAEAQSADAWTARARPTFLYLMYAVILLCFAGGIAGIWHPVETQTAAHNIAALLKALPGDLYALFGMGYLGYTGARSFDKWRARK